MAKHKAVEVGLNLGGQGLGANQLELGNIEFGLGKSLPFAINRVRANLRADMHEGSHELLFGERAIRIRIPKQAPCDMSIHFEGSSRRVYLNAIKIDFSAPIVLENFFTTLDEVQLLFADSSQGPFSLWSKASEYLNKFAEFKGVKLIRERVIKGALSESFLRSKEAFGRGVERAEEAMDNLIKVSLTSLECRAYEHFDGRILHIYFTGELIFNDKMRFAFNQLRIPESFIPQFYSDIGILLQQFCVDSTRGTSLMRSFLGMIEAMEGSISASLLFSGLDFRFITREERHLQLSLSGERELSFEASVDVGRVGEEIAFLAQGKLLQGTELCIHSRFACNLREEQLISLSSSLDENNDWRFSMLGTGKDLEGRWEVLHGSYVRGLDFGLLAKEGRTYVGFDGGLEVKKIELFGAFDFGMQLRERVVYLHALSLQIQGDLAFEPGTRLNGVDMDARLRIVQGPFEMRCVRKVNGEINATLHADVKLAVDALVLVAVFPEFGLTEPQMSLNFEGTASADLHASFREDHQHAMLIAFDHSKVEAQLTLFRALWCKAKISLENPAQFVCEATKLQLTNKGLQSSDFALAWDLESSPMLCVEERQAPLFVAELCHGGFDFHISNAGLVRTSGGSGLFDGHFFNALLNPAEEREKWLSLLDLENFGQTLIPTLRIVSEKAARFVSFVLKKVAAFKHFAKREGYHELKDFLPTDVLGRTLSQILVGSDVLKLEMQSIVEDIVQANGIDRKLIAHLVDRYFPDHEYHFELDRLLRWLDHVLSPIAFVRPEITHQPALCLQEPYLHTCASLPSAAQCYALPLEPESLPELLAYGCGFSLAQLQWLKDQQIACNSACSERLNTLIQIKEKIAEQEPQGGGYIFQDFSIDLFLGTLLERENAALSELEARESAGFEAIFRSLLSPEDVATLLSAGISSKYHGQLVQINQDRLFDLILRRGRDYAIAVFYEIGQGNVRILNSMLLSFLEQSQSHLRKTVNRAKAMSELLDYDVPNRADYMAGGHRAKDSYYAAIHELSVYILSQSQAYEAAKMHMQMLRNPLRGTTTTQGELEQNAHQLLQAADNMAQGFDFDNLEPDNDITIRLQSMRDAYGEAYAAAQTLLKAQPSAFKLAWFSDFWSRTHEMLVLRSFLRNLRDQVEECVAWTERRIGHSLPSDEQARLKIAIDILYFHPEDKERLLHDPLVRLQIEPPKGRVDLSIISSMGIITEGKQGFELASSYERLQKERGIKLVRTDTGTIRTLNYNADVIQRTIMGVEGPFAMVGYSQGCANMLEAERRLYQGTPQMREKLSKLVARQFLCSALNGSPHGSCGAAKYLQAIVEGEGILKFYQAVYSKSVIQGAFSILKTLMESRYGTHFLGSVGSVSHEGLAALSRDGQFSADVPSLSMRGVLSQDVPDCLALMRNHYIKQTQDPLNDSQVGEESAYGYFVWNRNKDVDELRRSAIATKTLEAHHWSPLFKDIEFVETGSDRERLVYRGPKDLFIFPWIEGLIMFGNLPIVADA